MAREVDVIRYDTSKPIRGEFVFENSLSVRITMARYVNGVERRVKEVDLDGTRFVPAPSADYDDVDVLD